MVKKKKKKPVISGQRTEKAETVNLPVGNNKPQLHRLVRWVGQLSDNRAMKPLATHNLFPKLTPVKIVILLTVMGGSDASKLDVS